MQPNEFLCSVVYLCKATSAVVGGTEADSRDTLEMKEPALFSAGSHRVASARATGLEPATSGSTVPFLRVVKPELESKLRQFAEPVAVPVAVAGESEGGNDDPDLSRLVAAWPTLAEPLKAAIRAMIASATGSFDGK